MVACDWVQVVNDVPFTGVAGYEDGLRPSQENFTSTTPGNGAFWCIFILI